MPTVSSPSPLAVRATRTTAIRRAPWATPVNQSVVVDGVEITILAYVVADDILRLDGVVRMGGTHDPVLADVPVLELFRRGGVSPLPSMGARVFPVPPLIWLAWLFRLASPEPPAISARIDQLVFGHRVGSRRDVVVGPWEFEFTPPAGSVRSDNR
jgi:hypothetical protein